MPASPLRRLVTGLGLALGVAIACRVPPPGTTPTSQADTVLPPAATHVGADSGVLKLARAIKVTVQPHSWTLSGSTDRVTLQGYARNANGPVAHTTWAWNVLDTTVLNKILSTKSAVTVVPKKNGTSYVRATAWGLSDSSRITVTGINPLPPGVAIQTTDNPQTVVDANASGTVFIVKTGTHANWTVSPKANDQFFGEPGAILDGGRNLSAATWTSDGAGHWYVTGQTQENTDYNVNYSCEAGHLGCYAPEQLWVNDSIYEHMTTLAAIDGGPQRWYFDYSADRIYLARNPASQKIITSVTVSAFGGTASGVVVKHLMIQHYANAAQKAVVNYAPGTGWRIDSNEIAFNHGSGFRLTGTATTPGKAYGNYVHDEGQMGYSCGGTGTVIEGNEIAYNNTAFFGTGQYAEFGSGKCATTTNLVFRNNYVHNNKGPGPWTDINNVGCLYENNTIDSNDYRGLFHEISFQCVIRNNLIRWNGLHNLQAQIAAGDRGGIVVSDSRDVEVYGNTLIGNFNGLMCIDADRSGDHPSTLGTHETENLYAHDNNVTQLSGRGAGCSDSDPNHDPFAVASNNQWGPGNAYTLTGVSRFRAAAGDVTWSAWRLTGQDAGSTETGQ